MEVPYKMVPLKKECKVLIRCAFALEIAAHIFNAKHPSLHVRLQKLLQDHRILTLSLDSINYLITY